MLLGITDYQSGSMHTNTLSHKALARLLCCALLGLPLIAKTAPLSLDDALERARRDNPELQSWLYQADEAVARIGVAGALPDPKAQFTYFGESVETRTGPQEAIYSLSQSIPWLSKLSTRKALASHDAEAVTLLHQEAQLRLAEAVVDTYSEAAYQQEAIRTTQAKLRWIEDTRAIVDEQVRGGASLNALLRLEVEMERTRDQLDQLAQTQFTQRTRLAALMGTQEGALGELAEIPQPENERPSAQVLHEALLTRNPELLALKRRIHSADAKVKLSKLERYPDFTFGIHYIQVGDEGAPFRDAGRDPWNVTIAFNLPIWEGKNRAAIQSAQSAERSAEQIYRNRVLQLQAELSATLARHADSMRRMQRYRERLIPLAEQALENSRAAYENGQVTVLEVIDSERALLDLELSHQRALANAHKAVARIQRLTAIKR
jgi:cobalt-zinc-cadmium efflux system outer membrane protein